MHGTMNVKSCKFLLVRVEVGWDGLGIVSFDVRIGSFQLEGFFLNGGG